MLDFRINIKADLSLKNTQYPIYFEKRNVCIHCGAENQLVFVDKFGNQTKKEIYPFDHIKCRNCGRTYSIFWQRDPENGRMFPTPVEREIKREFLNLMNRKEIRDKGVKEL